eukprot:2209149-Lingulodinium_polyedra.AAC.1
MRLPCCVLLRPPVEWCSVGARTAWAAPPSSRRVARFALRATPCQRCPRGGNASAPGVSCRVVAGPRARAVRRVASR